MEVHAEQERGQFQNVPPGSGGRPISVDDKIHGLTVNFHRSTERIEFVGQDESVAEESVAENAKSAGSEAQRKDSTDDRGKYSSAYPKTRLRGLLLTYLFTYLETSL